MSQDVFKRLIFPAHAAPVFKGRYTTWCLSPGMPMTVDRLTAARADDLDEGFRNKIRGTRVVHGSVPGGCPGGHRGLCTGSHEPSLEGAQILHVYVQRPRLWVHDYRESRQEAVRHLPLSLSAIATDSRFQSIVFNSSPGGAGQLPNVIYPGEELRIVATTTGKDETWLLTLFGDDPSKGRQ